MKKEVWKHTRNVILLIAGTLILAFGTAVFLLPFDLVAGGMSGLAIVIDAIIPSEFLTIDRIIALLTWVLFLVGFVIFGKVFAAKTFLSAILSYILSPVVPSRPSMYTLTIYALQICFEFL